MDNKNILKVIDSLRTPYDIRRILPGIIAEIVFNKEIYKSNPELRDFTNIFEKEYADYLFKARPLLYSRLIKELLEIQDEKLLHEHNQKIKNFLFNKNQINKKVVVGSTKSRTTSTAKNIEAWGKFINPGKYDEN